MFLARREFGKQIRVYRNCGAERIPRAWLFDTINPATGLVTSAAARSGTADGVAATGNSYSEAVENLRLVESKL